MTQLNSDYHTGGERFEQRNERGILYGYQDFTNSEGTEVTLIATLHLATQQFYDEVSQLLHKREAIVLKEGMRFTEEELEGDVDQAVMHERIWDLRDGYIEILNGIGVPVVNQRKGMQYPQTTIEADIELREFVDHLREHNFDFKAFEIDSGDQQAGIAEVSELATIDADPRLKREITRALFGKDPEPPEEVPQFEPGTYRYALRTLREDRLMAHFDAIAPTATKPIAIPWGGAHMESIVSELKKREFRPSSPVDYLVPLPIEYLEFMADDFSSDYASRQ